MKQRRQPVLRDRSKGCSRMIQHMNGQ